MAALLGGPAPAPRPGHHRLARRRVRTPNGCPPTGLLRRRWAHRAGGRGPAMAALGPASGETDPVPRWLEAARRAITGERLRSQVVKFLARRGDREPHRRTARAVPGSRWLGPGLIPGTAAYSDRGARGGSDRPGAAAGSTATSTPSARAPSAQALDAVEAARRVNWPTPVSGIRWPTWSGFTPHDIGRFAALDVAANLQPYWAHDDEGTRATQEPLIGLGPLPRPLSLRRPLSGRCPPCWGAATGR